MQIFVHSGEITQLKSDALITAINSGGMWFGGIDRVIQRAAGELFHAQAESAMPLADGQTVVALSGKTKHKGAFTNVIFVVDDLHQPLRNIIYAGLKAAADAGFKTVTLPTIRMGVMLGVVEKSKKEAVDEMTAGVKKFYEECGDKLEEITFVVYQDPETEVRLFDLGIKLWKLRKKK